MERGQIDLDGRHIMRKNDTNSTTNQSHFINYGNNSNSKNIKIVDKNSPINVEQINLNIDKNIKAHNTNLFPIPRRDKTADNLSELVCIFRIFIF
jgi:hypothetical protein